MTKQILFCQNKSTFAKVILITAVLALLSFTVANLYHTNRKINRLAYELQKSIPESAKKELVDLLTVYSVYDQDALLKFIRHGKENDGGYVIPEKALVESDVLLGYGIAHDNSFEDQFSSRYKKPSYGFDCGVTNIKGTNNLFTFIPECIGSDKFLYSNQKSSLAISSFEQQLSKLQLKPELWIRQSVII